MLGSLAVSASRKRGAQHPTPQHHSVSRNEMTTPANSSKGSYLLSALLRRAISSGLWPTTSGKKRFAAPLLAAFLPPLLGAADRRRPHPPARHISEAPESWTHFPQPGTRKADPRVTNLAIAQ